MLLMFLKESNFDRALLAPQDRAAPRLACYNELAGLELAIRASDLLHF